MHMLQRELAQGWQRHEQAGTNLAYPTDALDASVQAARD